MKRVNSLFFITILLIMNISCSYNENTLNSESPTIPITDSIAHPEIVIEKKDSLSPLKYIYLTIDDAPLNGSKYIDSVILNQKIKTSLFVVGNAIDGSSRFRKYYSMFQENPYVEIYNHSYSHANNKYTDYYKNPELVLNDFEKNQNEFNILHKIARLPGRNLWQTGEKTKNYKQTGSTSAGLLAENGYKIYGWDVEWTYNAKDYSPLKSIDELITEIENSYHSSKTFTPKHVVLLMHDQMFAKVNEKNNLGELITKLKEHDFIFEYLSSYPE
ncbi:peptidoglycan/xylan/chitin deacetylase (PgdA/CDA1 family) [Dysgonomonas alginatilytica]|uniref:Peptidoglycan/xylan/chitin deacetylase (PgdA/CDA1 family) n=1 Tax=Dysgonomonas alginatilytica TaxID=1605892 RepID=A0A2V3PP54_9BACT|nr:polysaccharide deacetylase family protein [Dysgonomonas alginatilytica]PXV64759.1 peptidoglycan/xylan/chitin deacetylase (PgdA/CDA1 family) [Dysgonomonas alginatilytica]